MLRQQARELALYYLTTYGEQCAPEDFLEKVKEMELAFLKTLQQRHEGAV